MRDDEASRFITQQLVLQHFYHVSFTFQVRNVNYRFIIH